MTDTSSLSLTVTSVSVVKAVSPSSVVAGSTTPIVYTITVKNTGTATTTAPIIVTDAAPSNATLDTTTAPTCTGGPPDLPDPRGEQQRHHHLDHPIRRGPRYLVHAHLPGDREIDGLRGRHHLQHGVVERSELRDARPPRRSRRATRTP